jgi:hypothetical protein
MTSLHDLLNSKEPNARKTVVFGATVLAMVLFLMLPSLPSLRSLFGSSSPAPRRPSPFAAPARPPLPVRPPASSLPIIAATPAIPGAGELAGKWEGQALLAGRGVCSLRIEIKDDPKEQGRISGFSTFGCHPVNSPANVARGHSFADVTLALTGRMNSTAEVLSGKWEDGAIRFHGEKSFSSGGDSCGMDSLEVTPFGNQIGTDFKQGRCGGGQIILHKVNG